MTRNSFAREVFDSPAKFKDAVVQTSATVIEDSIRITRDVYTEISMLNFSQGQHDGSDPDI